LKQEERIVAMENASQSEKELLQEDREIMLSAIPEIMAKLGKTEEEAKRLLLLVSPPELAAVIADDWETNPQALDLLKTLRSPLGNRQFLEASLLRAAEVAGLPIDEMIQVICLNDGVSINAKLEYARIAHERNMKALLISLNPSPRGAFLTTEMSDSEH
jgi:hypothetical protein